ncbi:aldo/keto reductase [Streptomyces sp. NPDC047043]|uniref:aldo/keto reductase n=1 Tax=Streptomyces sp. NPDC047043 TaxID=3154497 RepID=UPI0034049F9F
MTALDTAFNYHGFGAHRALARAAADLLPSFTISTKVGYFPDGHDVDPKRLRQAVERTTEALGTVPDTVLLHNAECSPDGFADACALLVELKDEGLCRAWGISSWDPRPLLEAEQGAPRPDTVMIRAGLAVPSGVLDAGEELAARSGAQDVWGMAPFGGSTTDPVWAKVDTSLFLATGQEATPLQAAIGAAFAIPEVSRLAVGTSRLDHLADAVHASTLSANTETAQQYRTLLRQRATVHQ